MLTFSFCYAKVKTTLLLFILVPTYLAAASEVIHVTVEQDLQSAVNSAAVGGVLLLNSGRHFGPITLSQQITLRGEKGAQLIGNGMGSVLTVAADGAAVEQIEIMNSGRDLSRDDAGVLILGSDVRIANVNLRNNLHGIYVRGGKNVRLVDNHILGLAASDSTAVVRGAEAALREDGIHHGPPGTQSLMGNGIHLWDAEGALVENCHIQHSRDGIYVAFTHRATFRNNRIHDSRYAIHYMYSSNNEVRANELWNNVAGAALMFSRDLEVSENILRDHSGFRAYGLLLQSIDTSNIERNEIRSNRAGLRLQNSNSNFFRSNQIHANLAAVTVNSSSRNNTFTRNRFGPNLRQIGLTGPVPPTDWSNNGVGNSWHGALPMDLTGDGISEWPHHEVDLLGEYSEDFPYVELLLGSPGILALEWAISRAPIPGTRYITDGHPLTRELDDD